MTAREKYPASFAVTGLIKTEPKQASIFSRRGEKQCGPSNIPCFSSDRTGNECCFQITLPGLENLLKSQSQLLLLVVTIFSFSGCAILPDRPELPYEQALSPAETGLLTDLARRFSRNREPQISGFRLLIDAREALESRLALIDLATQSIDMQYFIWKGDETGNLLFNRLLQAADRGVKVRIIVDDIWQGSTIKGLTALNAHPNMEIRVFNPNPSRDYLLGAWIHYLSFFQELNRRMHNKLMIVDNHVLVAGGRNLGNEYFGIGGKFNFVDLDVLAVGAVVGESSEAFDDYWNDKVVYPVSGWNMDLPAETLDRVRKKISSFLEEHKSRLASYPIHRVDWQTWLNRLEAELVTGEAHFLQDDPVQIHGRDYRLVDMIAYIADPTEEELIMVSPYLIPVDTSFTNLREETEKGVRVKLLTNSLASTNHTLVNSHYKKYRRRILETGAELYEFHHQPSADLRAQADVVPVTAHFISLHTKAIVSDRRKCFIGSLNFDPRAMLINSENGLLIESPELANQLTDYLTQLMSPENSWRVSIDEENAIKWQSADGNLSTQPARGIMQSIADFFGRLLPVESQL